MAVMLIMSGIIYLIFGSAEVQHWAMPNSVDENKGEKTERIIVVK
jgi:hypothetical protein